VYLVLAMASIQGGALAVQGASRQAARVYVQAGSSSEGIQQAQTAVDFALADYGLRSSEATVAITCSPHPADCLRRGSFVTVSVQASVPLPFAPPFLNLSRALAVPVSSASTEQVSYFWVAE
jgi:hypothetical protein